MLYLCVTCLNFLINMKLHEFLVLVNNRQRLVNFLVNLKIIINNLKCENCENIIDLDIDKLEFRCRKSYYVIDSHKKKKKLKCQFRQSVRKNTWFDKSKLSIEKNLYIRFLYILSLFS